MKTLTEWNTENYDALLDDESFEVVDWKIRGDEMLMCIDALLLPFKLEIVMRDAQDDSFHFKSGRIENV